MSSSGDPPLPSSTTTMTTTTTTTSTTATTTATTTPPPPAPYCEDSEKWEERVWMVRKHYEAKGYRVHSGLQFGCELVLYADDPGRVHSDFCVHVVPEGKPTQPAVMSIQYGLLDWRMMQSLVRSMPDLHKTLILANPIISSQDNKELQDVQEMAFATEHAPFRHRKVRGEVGSQRKKAKTTTTTTTTES